MNTKDGEVQRFRAMGLVDEEITSEFGFKVAPRNQQQEYWNEVSEDFKKRENPEKLKDLASSENKFEFSKYFWEKGMKSGTIATGYAMAKGKELPSGLQEDFNEPSIRNNNFRYTSLYWRFSSNKFINLWKSW